jgi:hypothetical protein
MTVVAPFIPVFETPMQTALKMTAAHCPAEKLYGKKMLTCLYRPIFRVFGQAHSGNLQGNLVYSARGDEAVPFGKSVSLAGKVF